MMRHNSDADNRFTSSTRVPLVVLFGRRGASVHDELLGNQWLHVCTE